MKYLAGIVLLLFITFLSTPTIVTLIEKQMDISFFYSFSEEEIHKEVKEIKANFNEEICFVLLDWNQQKKANITFENLSRHDNVFATIISLPPELV